MANREPVDSPSAFDLSKAFQLGEFVLHYQPIVDARVHSLAGVEGLVRWHHPSRGLLYPGEFLGALHRGGLMVELGRWALRTGMMQYERWGGTVPISINLGAKHLELPRCVDDVQAPLLQYGTPGALKVEITEHDAVRSSEGMLENLQALRDLGVKVVLDDFGTGHSSLHRLASLPVDGVKLDRAFAQHVGDPRHRRVTAAMIQLALDLGLEVVVEGVETRDELEILEELGAQCIQGFLFSKAIPAHEVHASYLKRARSR